MKKLLSLLLCLLTFLLLLSACTPTQGATGTETISPEQDISQSKILIAYFTWADNTNVADPDAVDTTLSTSASVIAPGNAAIVAGYIRDAVGGDLFSIKVQDLYPSNYDQCLDRASSEKATNARPALSVTVQNIEQYDIVFLGYPNWWYTVPMAIYSFLEQYDFSQKTVIPFCAHGTGGLASSVRDIARALPESTTFITNAFGVYRPNTIGCRPQVNSWLSEIGFEVA